MSLFGAARRLRRTAVLVGGLVAFGGVALGMGVGSNGLPVGRTPVTLDPADFTVEIDNPYYPLRPGDRRVYRETAPDGTRQRIVDEVLNRTKLIANGVTARVIRATVTNRAGKVVEYTEEWFAQDRAGNVWYFGEDTTKYENGKASKKGSFEAGVDGAQPGVQMPARPKAGMRFRLEGGYKTGAADHTEVLSVGKEQVEVPFGHFRGTVMNRDYTPLEPKVSELWFYAKGVGATGRLLPGASADWQTLLGDGTALGDIRYTLQTDNGDLLYVQSRGVRHGNADVLARLSRGEDVGADEYTFRTSTQIETAAHALDWLNKGIFISVAGRQPTSVVYDTYLVG
jgi:hypothetical protein